MSFKDINETVFQIKMVYFHEKKAKRAKRKKRTEESRRVEKSSSETHKIIFSSCSQSLAVLKFLSSRQCAKEVNSL